MPRSDLRLFSVLRRPLALIALVVERDRDRPPPSRASPDWRPGYRERAVPLAQLSEAICPWRDKDVKAWRALARVPRLEGRAALAVIRAVIGSVADPETVPDQLPPLTGDSFDLRPHLCHPDGEKLLIDRIADQVEAATAELDFPDWHWRNRAEIAELPREFRRSFLWGLHLSPWSMVRVTAAVFDELELAGAPELRLAVAQLLLRAERRVGLAWCAALAEVAPTERARAAELIVESELWRLGPSPDVTAALVAADWASPHLAGG